MNLNAYDTSPAKPFKVVDQVEGTLKTLALTRDLKPTKNPGVFVIDHENARGLQKFAFPLTLQTHTREHITVYDERPYRSSANKLINKPEAVLQRLTACLQQDVINGNLVALKKGRMLTVKAFANGFSNVLSRKGGLDLNETLKLKILLAYYYTGLMENPNLDFKFVAANVIRSIYGTEKSVISDVIDELPYLANLQDLLAAIKGTPGLFKLKSLDWKDFLSLSYTLSYSAMGKFVVGAASEAPCLMMAYVYTTIKNPGFNKTALGTQLDPKYNRELLEPFTKGIEFSYDLAIA